MNIDIKGIDLFIIIFYLVAIPLFGFYFKRYVKSDQDFFLAGKMLPWWVISFSIIGTNIGATDYIGGSGAAYRYGIAQINYEWLGAIPAMILAALIFIPYYYRSGSYTIPEFVEKRYNSAVRVILAVFYIIWFAIIMAIFIWAAALTFNTYLGLPIWNGIVIIAIIVGLYTITGGLAAVAMTDVAQILVMFIGGLALCVIGLWTVGGFDGLVDMIKPDKPAHFDLFLPANDANYPWLGIVLGLGLVVSPAWWCTGQPIIQRTLGAKSEWDARAGMLFAAFPKMLIPLLVVVPGLIALALNPGFEGADGDKAFPWLVKNLLPTGLAGLVTATFLAALISSIDSMLNSAATVWTKDVYQRLFKKNASTKHYLNVGRIITALLLVVGASMAYIVKYYEDGIYLASQVSMTMFMGSAFSIILLGIMWKRATRWGGLSGLCAGIITALTLLILDINFLYAGFCAFTVATIINVLVSLLTKPEPEEKIEGLVYKSVLKNKPIQKNIEKRINGGNKS